MAAVACDLRFNATEVNLARERAGKSRVCTGKGRFRICRRAGEPGSAVGGLKGPVKLPVGVSDPLFRNRADAPMMGSPWARVFQAKRSTYGIFADPATASFMNARISFSVNREGEDRWPSSRQRRIR